MNSGLIFLIAVFVFGLAYYPLKNVLGGGWLFFGVALAYTVGARFLASKFGKSKK